MNHQLLEELIQRLVSEAFGKFNFAQFKQIAQTDVRPQGKKQEEDFAWAQKQHPEIAYAQKHLPLLGKGSSRITFALNSGKVLKIALNRAGFGQNQAELDVFTHSKDNTLVTKIFDFAPDFKWLVSEIVKEFETEEEFTKLTHIPIMILDMVRYELSKKPGITSSADLVTGALEDELHEKISWNERQANNSYFRENERREYTQMAEEARTHLLNLEKTIADPVAYSFIVAVLNMMKTHNLVSGDIVPYHFGRTATGEVRLLDSGATREVMNKYY